MKDHVKSGVKMQYSKSPRLLTHEDCANFRNGFCLLHGATLDPNGPACPSFISKNPSRNSHTEAEFISSPARTVLKQNAKAVFFPLNGRRSSGGGYRGRRNGRRRRGRKGWPRSRPRLARVHRGRSDMYGTYWR